MNSRIKTYLLRHKRLIFASHKEVEETKRRATTGRGRKVVGRGRLKCRGEEEGKKVKGRGNMSRSGEGLLGGLKEECNVPVVL